MTHAASFGLSAGLRRALEDACEGGGDAVGGLQIRVVDEAFALMATLPGATKAQQLAESVASLLDIATPCFFLLRLPKLGWALASWVPDASDVRQRMLHSSGRETLRKTVAALTSLAFEAHWASASEVDVANLFAEPVGELATLALLTDVERLALADAQAIAAEAAAGKVTSAALAFPLQPLAANALAEFEKGVRDLLLLRVEGESVGLLPSPSSPPAEPAPLEAMLPTDAPCYALMRYPQEVLAILLPKSLPSYHGAQCAGLPPTEPGLSPCLTLAMYAIIAVECTSTFLPCRVLADRAPRLCSSSTPALKRRQCEQRCCTPLARGLCSPRWRSAGSRWPRLARPQPLTA